MTYRTKATITLGDRQTKKGWGRPNTELHPWEFTTKREYKYLLFAEEDPLISSLQDNNINVA
jgi:hypothetical protein